MCMSLTSDIWCYSLLKERPAQGKRLNLPCGPFSYNEVKRQADPKLWQPVKAEDQVQITEIWLFMCVQCAITHTWDFYRGKLIMLPSKGLLSDAHRNQYYDIDFRGKKKAFICESTGKETGNKAQICLPDPKLGGIWRVSALNLPGQWTLCFWKGSGIHVLVTSWSFGSTVGEINGLLINFISGSC